MKTLVACLLCFVFGTAVGSFWTKQEVDEPGGSESSLRSAIPGLSGQSYRDVNPQGAGGRPVFDFDSLHLLNPIDLYRAIEHLDAGALKDLIGDVRKLPLDDGVVRKLQNQILVRFAQIDPEEALSFSQAAENDDWYRIVYIEIAKQDLGNALALLEGTQDRVRFESLLYAVLESGAPGASPAVFDLLQEDGDLLLAKHAIRSMASGFRDDLEGGIAFFESLPASQMSAALVPLLENIAKKDPQRALALLEAHGQDRGARLGGISSIADSWLRIDPEAAQAWIGSLENFHEKEAAVDEMVGMKGAARLWAAEQIALLASDPKFSSHAAKSLATNWAKDDPLAALKWVADLPPGEMRSLAGFGYWPVGTWEKLVADDPAAMTAVYESLPAADRFGSSLARSMIAGWGRVDPEAAANYASASREDDSLSSALDSLLVSWARRDFEAAQGWVSQVDESRRRWATDKIIEGIAEGDHLAAAAELDRVTEGLGGEAFYDFNGSAHAIAERWSRADPQAAVEWAMALPENDQRVAVMTGVFEEWLEAEPEEASAWLVEAEPGLDRDRAIRSLIGTIASDDWENALHWVDDMSVEREREAGFRRLISNWRERDRGAARAAVESLDVSEEFRQTLLEEFPVE